MKQEYRKIAVLVVVWIVIASMLYFSNIKQVSHECHEISGWLSLWNYFTFGVAELFPYKIEIISSNISQILKGEFYCSEKFEFYDIGYIYFIFTPVIISAAAIFSYKWIKRPNNAD